MQDTDQAIRDSNLTAENQVNMDFKGGIPQSHHYAHKNSIKSFKELKPGGRYAQIFRVLKESPIPLTDREIMKMLGYVDKNKVSPRITEMVDFELILECGETLDFETRRPVRIVKINPEFQPDLPLG